MSQQGGADGFFPVLPLGRLAQYSVLALAGLLGAHPAQAVRLTDSSAAQRAGKPTGLSPFPESYPRLLRAQLKVTRDHSRHFWLDVTHHRSDRNSRTRTFRPHGASFLLFIFLLPAFRQVPR